MAIIALAVFWLSFKRDSIPLYKHILLIVAIGVIGLLGARLFYIAFVNPSTPPKPFARDSLSLLWNGLYGSFILGVLCFPIIIKFLYPPSVKNKLWDISSILLSLAYGVLRIGCLPTAVAGEKSAHCLGR